MAETGEKGRGGREGGGGGGGGGLKPPHDPQSPALCPSPAPPEWVHSGVARKGIVIQLTGTDGDWDSLDDNELIFSLENDEDYPSISLSKERQYSAEDDERGLRSPAFHVPLSPSSPGSLGDCSISAPSFLSPGPASPTHQPLSSLVKSLSTELELKEGSSLRPRPLLSLVKSISTELSRSEPEVSQSKSDSRLNLHLWKQLTQSKGRSSGDSRTAPPSPSSFSPPEGARGFFKMELEDKRRKLTEAMHEPLSMFSKIMKEENSGSPKHQRAMGTHPASSPSPRGVSGTAGRDSGEVDVTVSPVRSGKRVDGDSSPLFDWPCVRHPMRAYHRTCSAQEHHSKPNDKAEELEICTYGDVMQVVVVETRHRRPQRQPGPSISSAPSVVDRPSPPLPCMGLFCVAALSYIYFILPLSPYLSGLAMGLAMGFLLGLLLIRLGTSRSPAPPHRRAQALNDRAEPDALSTEPDILKGWMNEMFEYDPENYHPSLTHSVYAILEGSCLRLDYPRSNISRRVSYDDKPQEAVVVSSRSYQLAHSKVFLLPSALARKRLWNIKYPICIVLEEGERAMEEGTVETLGEEQELESPTQTHPSFKHPPAVTPDIPTTLYLFGRTGREKEEWFHHFLSASMVTERGQERPGRCVSRPEEAVPMVRGVSASGCAPGSRGSSQVGSTEEDLPTTPTVPSTQTSSSAKGASLLDYHTFMARLLATEEPNPLPSPGPSSTETSPTTAGQCTCDFPDLPGEGQTAWVNALIGRIFWDFLREKYWADLVSHKIQKKLSKIRLPYFMNELTLTELDMGSGLPQVTGTSRPMVNHQGLWLELEVVYTGALQMTLETKMNLSKLGKEGGLDTDSLTEAGSLGSRPILSVLADSDEESSSAGSSDEEEVLLSEPQGLVGEKGTPPGAEGAAAGGGRTGKRILRFVDKIAKSKYFQKATENEFIKKKIEEMSNTPLLLAVEVQELSGTLVVNIPPPPTDRIWYSFCVPPKLDLRVRPKLGEREVTFCHVTEWIEKKLQDEFQKVFVLPNMDDIYLPLMHSGMDSQCPASQQCPAQSSHTRNSSTDSIEQISQEHTPESE